MKIWRCAAFVAAFCVCAVQAASQTVTLSLKDGSFSVSGKMRSFDGEFYDLDTPLGPMTLSAATTDCLGSACPDPDDYVPFIRVSGSAALGEVLVPALIETFATQRGLSQVARVTSETTTQIDLVRSDARLVATFEISLSSTDGGYRALSEGQSDIVLARRGPTAAEDDAIRAAYEGGSTDPIRLAVIGWEALRLYTNADNPITALTVRDLIGMISAPDSNWPTTTDRPVHYRGDADSIIALQQQLGQTEPTVQLGGGADTDPGILYVTPNLSLPLTPVRLTGTCGTAQASVPFQENQNPLAAPVYLVTSAIRQSALMREFLDFTLDLPAQRVIDRAGFISRTPSEAALSSENGILEDAILNATDDTSIADLQRTVQALKGYGRLSLTFRFTGGTMELDDVSRSNLDFAASLLRQGRYRDRQILFAGFSDGVGDPDANLALSRDRARVVRDAIRTRMGENAPPLAQFRTQGFGETLPLACNDTRWGQNQNRRVELWIR